MSQQQRFLDRFAALLEDLVEGRWHEGAELDSDGLSPVEARMLRSLRALQQRSEDRERELVTPLIAHMVEIAGGHLRLTWEDVKAVESRSPPLSEALAGLLNLNEELRFSEEQHEEARRKQSDLNERLAAQNAELLREREAMAALVRDLSAVMLEVSRGVLLIPLAGPYDSARAHDVTARALDVITARSVHHVILDFTGVPRIDEGTAQLFVQLAQGASLLGAIVVAAGVQADVAKTMTSLGVGLSGMAIARGVEQAIAMCTSPAVRLRA
jgi:rsbT co-antagonist protein RsbR